MTYEITLLSIVKTVLFCSAVLAFSYLIHAAYSYHTTYTVERSEIPAEYECAYMSTADVFICAPAPTPWYTRKPYEQASR